MTADLRPYDLRRAADGEAAQDGGVTGDGVPAVRVGRLAVQMRWREAAVASAVLVRDRPALVAVGLLGFLARGGLVLFLLPIVVLPTPTGISNFIGGTALTGSGPSEGLIRLIAVGVLLVLGLVAAGVVLGAFADVLLSREAATFAQGGASATVAPSVLGRLVVVRVVMLVPVALAVAWGTSRLVAAGYHQLILPDDLTLPLAVRILIEAADAAVVVAVVWLVAEFFGGLAVRHVILAGRSAPGAASATIRGVLRRPLTSIATWITGVLGLVITAGPTLLLAAALWSRLQALLADEAPIVVLLPATFVFVLVWGGGLFVVGVVVAWRSVLGSLDVLRAGPGFFAPAGAPGPPDRKTAPGER